MITVTVNDRKTSFTVAYTAGHVKITTVNGPYFTLLVWVVLRPCHVVQYTARYGSGKCWNLQHVTAVLQLDTIALQRSQQKMTTFTTVLSRERSSKIKRQNNHPIKPSLKSLLKAFQRPSFTNRTFHKKAFKMLSKAFFLPIDPSLKRPLKAFQRYLIY